MENFKVALCQLTPVHDKNANVEHACGMLETAAEKGAKLAVLPEMFNYPFELAHIPEIADSGEETLERMVHIAKRNKLLICTGSMAIRDREGIHNRSFLISPTGDILLTYDKSHLFDISFKGLTINESSVFVAGKKAETVKTDLATIGIAICYDIRFPEIIRSLALAGAEVLIVPAAFSNITGPAHWEVILRSRAIENQCFLLAVSQGKNPKSSYRTYGHSMVVSPWGEILTEASDSEEILYADLDSKTLVDTRARIPIFQQRRPELYNLLVEKK